MTEWLNWTEPKRSWHVLIYHFAEGCVFMMPVLRPPTPVFLPANPTYRGAWWARVHGVTSSRTWLKWPSMYMHMHRATCIIWIHISLFCVSHLKRHQSQCPFHTVECIENVFYIICINQGVLEDLHILENNEWYLSNYCCLVAKSCLDSLRPHGL